MELHEYPRPANDTGIGIHWTVGFASTIGMGKIRDYWIPEMKAMGIKWVKIFNHDGAIDFAELLLAEGFMPIVRIFRPSPNPSALDIREIVHLDAFIRAGVRYFEFNSEPDLDSEWKGGRVPANGLDLVVENTIPNMETILERGGMPAVPALSNGNHWDLVGGIVARRRKDLLTGPVWQAIHNYSRNRPLDYPYDIGSQEGAPYTPRFYEVLVNEAWAEDPWRGRSLTDVNRLRLDRCSPGATIEDDNACWLAYEYFDARNRRHLGQSIPILSTECGYLVGEDVDPRYPATTPDLHMAQTLEACRVMMGTSNRFAAAPDYFFCTAFWLLGNATLGSSSTWCEHHAWYSSRWPGLALPIVRALNAEAKVIRHWQDSAQIGARTTLHGTVQHAGDRRTVVLEKNGKEVARATLDANSRYLIPDLLPGSYLLHVEGTAVEQTVSLQPGQESVIFNLDLSESIPGVSGSMISGQVRGGAGAVVMLLRTSDGEEWVTMAREDGTFRFVDLPAGIYNVRVQGEGSRAETIVLDGKNRHEVDLVFGGWGYTVRSVEEGNKLGAIRCSVEGYTDLQVQVHTGDWSSEPTTTGSAPEFGEYACEITALEVGHYVVSAEGLSDVNGKTIRLEAYVNVDKLHIPVVEFVYSSLSETRAAFGSAIHGRIVGGCTPDKMLYVWLFDEQANRQEQIVSSECTFVFEGLGAGQYSVELVGYADVASRSDIALDGKNLVEIELYLPFEEEPEAEVVTGQSLIRGIAPATAGGVAKLVDSVGNEVKQTVDHDDTFRFENLESGVYSLEIEGGYAQSELDVDGRDGIEIEFMPLVETWEVKVSPAGSMPGYSVVRTEVEGMRGLPVYIWKEDWEGMMRRTGSKPEYGECSAEFSPLGPGHYMVEPEGLGVWADVELTGLEVVWIDFRRRSVPERPNIVERLVSVVEPKTDAAVEAAIEADTYVQPPPPEEMDEDDTGEDFADDAYAEKWESEGGADVVEERTVEEPAADAEHEPQDAVLDPVAVGVSALAGGHYLAILSPVDDVQELGALLRYVAQEQPVIVEDVADVQDGDVVLLVGSSDELGLQATAELLKNRGAVVHRFSADLFCHDAPGETAQLGEQSTHGN